EELMILTINAASVAMHLKHMEQSEELCKKAIALACEVQGKSGMMSLLAIRLYIDLLTQEHRFKEAREWQARAKEIEALRPGQDPFTIGSPHPAESGSGSGQSPARK
ncbi:MAG: hypothetical protein ACRD3W_30090, partial [Terriglobales bacterium]